MTHGYNKTYLYDAQNNLGDFFDYGINDCGYPGNELFSLFISSKIANEFGKGNPKYIAGMSGIELLQEVILRTYRKPLQCTPTLRIDKTPEFWAGWALAYYQWKSGHSFTLLQKILSFSDILARYPTLHQADVEKFAELCENRLQSYRKKEETPLAKFRKIHRLSQRKLAEKSEVSLRMIQLYEQKQNDIAKASGQTLRNLSKALDCTIEDLLEY